MIGILGAFLLGIANTILTIAVITTIVYLTLNFLKNKFRKRENSTIVAADMQELIKSVKKTGTKMTFDDLEALEEQANETPIIIAEYDEDTDEVVQVQGAKDTESKLEHFLKSNGVLVIED